MKSRFLLLVACLSFLGASTAQASERLFTYTYEPETMPQGGLEYEQHVTLRTPRSEEAGQDDYVRWDIKEELEYGVTDYYTLALYLNEKSERYKDTETGEKESEFSFEGVSFENKFMVWNPAEHAVGLSFYIEPRFAADETELEEKIIIGQRSGDWKWAFNVTHETEWTEAATEGAVKLSLGITKKLNQSWNLGVEIQNNNKIEEYEEWGHSVFFAGPAISYHNEKWWATVTALGQVFGRNYGDDTDGERNFVLDGAEYLNIRCIVGFDF